MEASAGPAVEVRLLLDEMHAPAVAEALAASGHDVVAVAADPLLRGRSDREVLEHACDVGRAVVTENVGDFAALAARWAGEGQDHCGLVFTSPRRFNRASLAVPGNLITALRTFLESPPVQGRSWQWWLS